MGVHAKLETLLEVTIKKAKERWPEEVVLQTKCTCGGSDGHFLHCAKHKVHWKYNLKRMIDEYLS